jgi:ribosomal-protein-alanine N-acetyltransferase
MTFVLAPMRWWDIPAVHDIEADLFPDDAWSAEQFWQELSQPTRHYLVARGDDGIVGYAGALVVAPDSDLQTIGVRADQQGRGVASELLVELLEDAARCGATHMLLEVRADNERAVTLYERFGFARISQRRRYYPDGSDAIIMRRPAGDRPVP